MLKPVYLDYNATTPCDPRVVDTMLPYFTSHFGNPASIDHSFGWLAQESVELAREQIASLINAYSKQVVFTSGATESVNLALKGMAEANVAKGRHIITSKAEHKAVLDTCAYLEKKGFLVTYLPVDPTGIVLPEELERAIRKDTICIALMYANNETGMINPVREIGHVARKHGICFMCDATQAVGKVSVDVCGDHIDLMPFSAHKMYGPKGIGALFIRTGNPKIHLFPQQHGGDHERGNRSGTLNTPGIIGFGQAAELCRREMQAEAMRLCGMRDRLEEKLLVAATGATINGKGYRLPHVSNVLFPGIDAEQLLLSVSKHVALSRGSACSGLVQRPSHVLRAMGLNEGDARNAIRISLGRFTTDEHIVFAVDVLVDAVARLQLKKHLI